MPGCASINNSSTWSSRPRNRYEQQADTIPVSSQGYPVSLNGQVSWLTDFSLTPSRRFLDTTYSGFMSANRLDLEIPSASDYSGGTAAELHRTSLLSSSGGYRRITHPHYILLRCSKINSIYCVCKRGIWLFEGSKR